MGSDAIPPVQIISRIDQAVAALTQLITSGQMQIGDYLPSEADLCRQLGVSRTTVREALRTLEARGLVTSRHGVGVQVTDGASRAVSDSISLMLLRLGAGPRDMLEVRLMIEGEAAALAAQRATAADLLAIESAIHAMAAPALTQADLVQADLDFHAAVADASHNHVLVALIHALRGLLHDVISLSHARHPNIALRIVVHSRVLAAIRQGNAREARAAMRAHLVDAARLLIPEPIYPEG